LETIIDHEARLAGLLEHGTSIGHAREFFVRRVLRSILPPLVHIGRGKVIGATSEPSKQIDIVIFDPRFPILEIESGMGLYPVEGVIATIEVKSMQNGDKLTESLENCYSVMQVSPYSVHEDLHRRVDELMGLRKLTHREAESCLAWSLQPKTYVFGFTGYKTPDALCSAIEKWYNDKGRPGSVLCPFLPRVLISEGALGLSADNWVFLPKCPNPEKEVVMQFVATERRFGIFALHLLHAVSERLGALHAQEKVRFSHEKYFPWDEYMAEMKMPEGYGIMRERTR
jgi:hypothetical protein